MIHTPIQWAKWKQNAEVEAETEMEIIFTGNVLQVVTQHCSIALRTYAHVYLTGKIYMRAYCQ